jgi:hypothetical protein
MLVLSSIPAIKQLLLNQLQVAIGSHAQAAGITSDGIDRIMTPAAIPLKQLRDDPRVVYRSAIALKLSSLYQLPALDLAEQLVNYLPESPTWGDFKRILEFDVGVTNLGSIDFHLTDRGLANWLQHLTENPLIQPPPHLQRPYPVSPLLAGEGLGVRSREVASKDQEAFRKAIADRKSNTKLSHNLFPVQYAHARCCSLLCLGHSQNLIKIKASGYSILEPNPIPWLNPEGKLYLVQPAERKLIAQLLWLVDELHGAGKPHWMQLAIALSQTMLDFHSSCRIWGEVKTQTPQLVQARLGLVGIARSGLRTILEDIFDAPAPSEL